MALTADQRAMLQLLLERRQSYEDIGSLLGLSTDEVRSRARGVLKELGGEDPDADVGLTDYLLGQADPIGRADVARHLQSDEHAAELARSLVTQLQVLAPDAELPDLPAKSGRAKAPKAPSEKEAAAAASAGGAVAPSKGRGLRDRISGSLADRQSRIIAALLASTVLVVIIVLVASGTFSGGDDEGNGSKDSANFDSVPVELTAPAGSNAKGNAVFTNVGDRTNQISFQISASGLDPTPKGSTYTIWLYIDPKHAYPLAPVTVPANGKLTATRPIPNIFTTTQTGLAVLARFQKVRLSLTPTKQLAALVSAAVKKQTPLVPYIGKTALEGDIPGSVRGAAQGGTGTQPGATTTQP